MVHEPGLGFGEGGLRHDAAAAVHRLMSIILLRRASHVWISIPAWEVRLKPYTLGRKVPFTWLPVPSNIPVEPGPVAKTNPIGYFGQYDAPSIENLNAVLDRLSVPVLLIGRGADRVSHPKALLAGELAAPELSRTISSCRVIFHLYPDGVSSRRGTMMASLAHGMPIVANEGRLSESIWRSSGAVALASDFSGIALQLNALLHNPEEQMRLSDAALSLYREQFALSNTIRRLMCASR